MIVWVASYPRAANSFFLVCLSYLYRIRFYSIYREDIDPGFLDQFPALQELFASFPNLSPPKPLAKMARDARYYFVKTHELPRDGHPAVYLVRDGRDSLVSYAHFILASEGRDTGVGSRAFEEVLYRLVATDKQYGGWGNHVRAWLGRRAPTAVVQFEGLVRSPCEVVERAVRELEIPLAGAGGEVPDFESLHRASPKLWRNGRTGSYREEMTGALQELFWKRHGDAMRAIGHRR